jgi:SHS2 domain-containing protein
LSAAGHQFEAHTSEVRVRLWAPDWGGLLEEAARALCELMGEEDLPAPSSEPGEVRLQARDAEALLVDWLNELIFRAETAGLVLNEVRVTSADPTHVEAVVRGARVETLRTAVKAATFHGLRVDVGPEGVTAAVVLDV